MNCDACSKYFSGIVPYNQHIESEKHKKKVANLSMWSTANTAQSKESENKPASVFNQIYCPACKISFDSIVLFQSHSLTLEHVKNASEKFIGVSEGLNGSIDRSKPDTVSSSQDETDYIVPPMQHFEIAHLATFSECKACNKQFSGPEPYKQHLVSAAHKKKVEMVDYLSKPANQNVFNRFECVSCQKMFSGPVPFEQHMVSDVHRKKLQQLELLAQFQGGKKIEYPTGMECDSSNTKSGAGNFKNMDVKYPWFCKTCLIQCSGLISFKQHLDGDSHLKNVKKEELLKCTPTSEKSTDDSITQAPVFRNNEQTFAAPLLNIGIKNSQDMETDSGIKRSLDTETDLILPEALINLSVVSPSDINVKEFYPDVKIDFDSCSSKQKPDTNGMKMDDSFLKNEQAEDTKSSMVIDVDGSQNQNLEDSDNQTSMYESAVGFQANDVYEECKLCNVKLRNKNEALSHFESYEHFMKKHRGLK